VADDDALVTVGIPPRAPETGFGYIHAAQGQTGDASFLVESFKEKPDAATAREYFTAGGYYWNAGIFVWRAQTFTEMLKRHAPELAHAIDDVVDAWFTSGVVDSNLWDAVPRIAIDYALLEPAADAGNVRVVPAAFQWWDLGTWPSIVELATKTGGEALSLGARGTVTSLNSENCFVHQSAGSNRAYALLGVKDIIVVDTGDVTMIADSRAAQDVKSLVVEMEKAGRVNLI
jgi:mannose-1-phosphate guanylyltransferase